MSEQNNLCKNCKQPENLHSFPHKRCPTVRDAKFEEMEGLVYEEAYLNTVLRHYAAGFNPKPDSVEFFIDTAKEKVIFKCFFLNKKD